MGQSDSSGSDRRRWPRVALEARVSLSSATLDDLVSGPLQDLSAGGLFIESRATKPIGTELTVSVAITEANVKIECRGMVVREVTVEEAREAGRAPGMGILFTEMDDETRRKLAGLLAVAMRRKEAAR